MMTDFHKLWRNELLDDLRTKRDRVSYNIKSLKNVGSVYYDSHESYLKMIMELIRVVEDFPETIDECRERYKWKY